jgi:hypothetical protein
MSERRRRSTRSRFRGNYSDEKEKESEKSKTKEKERSREKDLKEEKKEKEEEKEVNNIILTSQNDSSNPEYSSIHLNKEKLLELLKCPLCKGYYRTPYTINECMHTFCRSCIFKYFGASAQRETCPICNTKIGGRPMDSLIYDNYLDSLLNILFPKFEEIDKKNIKLLYKKFREIGNSLPDDEEEAKLKRPNVKIYIMPENKKEHNFFGSFLVPKNFDVKSLKELILKKINKSDIDTNFIIVKYKDNELLNNFTMEIIDNKYGFDQDKNTFYYDIIK